MKYPFPSQAYQPLWSAWIQPSRTRSTPHAALPGLSAKFREALQTTTQLGTPAQARLLRQIAPAASRLGPLTFSELAPGNGDSSLRSHPPTRRRSDSLARQTATARGGRLRQ